MSIMVMLVACLLFLFSGRCVTGHPVMWPEALIDDITLEQTTNSVQEANISQINASEKPKSGLTQVDGTESTHKLTKKEGYLEMGSLEAPNLAPRAKEERDSCWNSFKKCWSRRSGWGWRRSSSQNYARLGSLAQAKQKGKMISEGEEGVGFKARGSGGIKIGERSSGGIKIGERSGGGRPNSPTKTSPSSRSPKKYDPKEKSSLTNVWNAEERREHVVDMGPTAWEAA